jgi:HEAT repeat protein
MSERARIVWFAVALSLWAQAEPRCGGGEPKETPAEAIAKALKALETPEYTGVPPGWSPFRMKSTLPYTYCKTCQEALDFLVRTKAEVDKQLLDLARTDKRLLVRYRAIRILAGRANGEVIPLLDTMCASEDADERYLAWTLYEDAIQQRKLPAPKDFTRHLQLYAGEKDTEVRERIEWFFAAAKAKAAVKALREAVRDNPGGALPAVWALGDIGDGSAAQVIMEDFGKGGNDHYHMQALGKLATPEAVDFIIAHLDTYRAVEALCATKSAKALPVLKKHLEKLKQQKGPDNSLGLAATRIAIIRLSEEDPRETLMAIFEDAKEAPYLYSATVDD